MEYLAILAAVLVLALIAVALAGEFTPLAKSVKEVQSLNYWKGAYPFSIKDYALGGSNVTLVIVNRLTDKVTLTDISFNGDSIGPGNVTFFAGEERTISGTAGSCEFPGQGFQYDLLISYDERGISGKKQFGDRPLAGKCIN
jgi:hypothetical protein